MNIAIDENTGELLGIDIALAHSTTANPLRRQFKMFQCQFSKGWCIWQKSIFNYCRDNGIKPAIKIRKNSIKRSRGSLLRKKCLIELMDLGEDAWKEKYGYGKRWLVESYFSAVKRSYGEAVKSRRSDMLVKEAMIKFLLYATVRQIA